MTATSSASRWRAVVAGLILAACFGLLSESTVLLAQMLGSEYLIPRSARVARAGLVAGASTAAAGLIGLLYIAINRVREQRIADVANLLALAGFGFCAWMVAVFVAAAPDPSSIRLTRDPIVHRGWAMLAASLLVPLVAIVLYRYARRVGPRWKRIAGTGVAAAAPLGLTLLALPAQDPGPGLRRPDIFLLSVDTLRADHLGCYGYALPTSPNLDRLCENSIVFENAMAPAPVTIPSYTSLMTGLLQDDHGVYSNYHKADASLVTLAERLRDAGYVTGAIIDGAFPGTFANVAQGFDHVTQRGVTARSPLLSLSEGLHTLVAAVLGVLAERLRWEFSPTTRAAERWLSELPPGRPAFAHFYWPFPHDPYRPPPRFLRELPRPDADPEVADLIHRYDAEIRFADVQIERILLALRERGRYEEAWIVFTADHGEELGRVVQDASGAPVRYTGHSRYLFDSSIRVPLVVRPPASTGISPRRDDVVVSTASLAATVLDAAGAAGSDGLQAPLPIVGGRADGGYAFSVARSPIKPVDLVSIRTREWRLVETRQPEAALELYRYDAEGESQDQAAARPEIVAELLRRIHAWDPPDPEADPEAEAAEVDHGLSERERRHLEALGYVF